MRLMPGNPLTCPYALHQAMHYVGKHLCCCAALPAQQTLPSRCQPVPCHPQQELTRSSVHPVGGQAYLSLDSSDEPFLHGIKFTAMPPTKRFRWGGQAAAPLSTYARLRCAPPLCQACSCPARVQRSGSACKPSPPAHNPPHAHNRASQAHTQACRPLPPRPSQGHGAAERR